MKPRKYTREILQEAVDKSVSMAGVLRLLQLKQTGGNQSWIKHRIVQEGIDTSHFLGQRTNSGENHMGGHKRRSAYEILCLKNEIEPFEKCAPLRKALLEIGRKPLCEICNIGCEWNGKELVLQIDHINGRRNDNRSENLRFLCPNCHSQTDTFSGKNKNKRAGVV